MTFDELFKSHTDIYIVDTYNRLCKYHYGINHRIPAGDDYIDAGAYEGMVGEICNIRTRSPNSAILYAVEGHCTFRKEMNPAYKATRPTGEDVFDPAAILPDVLMVCSLAPDTYLCRTQDLEADDVIGTIAALAYKYSKAHAKTLNVFVCSTDKDMFQLVRTEFDKTHSFSVREMRNMTDDIVDESVVFKTFGVEPADLLKFRAIKGDPSDNLKGYFRFFTKDAAYIASHCDIDVVDRQLRPKPHTVFDKSYQKALDVINNDFDTFDRNYQIMRLYYGIPLLLPLGDKYKEDKQKAEKTVQLLGLNRYKSYITARKKLEL